MTVWNESTRDEPTSTHRPHGTVAVRSYQDIATILSKREGVHISAERVKQTCETADLKIAQALRAGSARGTAPRGGAEEPTDNTAAA